MIQEQIPITVHEVPSGTKVFDWTIPLEWNIRDAYIKDGEGNKVVDFSRSNLHIVGYSVPVNTRLSLSDLKEHLYTLPDHPDWIPYRTSYYKKDWGFCLTHRQLLQLKEGEYEVVIDSSLSDGNLVYGECYLKGERQEEILISCHICHPSLCNDNLSGIGVATFLAKWLCEQPLRYSCRFLFIPATIGSISWLAKNQGQVSRIKHGFVLTGVGDAGPLTYKKSRNGTAEVDRAFCHVLRQAGLQHTVIEFFPYGYDERQYCSPGFDLPVGCLMRTPHGQYPEYHTSADNLEFVKPESLAGSLALCKDAMDVLQHNGTYVNTNPFCEVQLGRRGLYRAVGGQAGEQISELALLWILNLSDGRHSLLDIAERSGYPFKLIRDGATVLMQHGLLKESV
jgi:aminopeptidase-like protein